MWPMGSWAVIRHVNTKRLEKDDYDKNDVTEWCDRNIEVFMRPDVLQYFGYKSK